MGTNFYYVIPLKEDQVNDLREMITSTPNFYEVRDKLYDLEGSNKIHLGKRSYGWQFLWDYHNGKYYKDSLKSIKEFLNSSGGYIQNEYGDKFTIEEFFEDEIASCLYKDKNHCDSYQYYKEHPDEPLYYDIFAHEFISKDKLRFSKDENFS